LVAGRGEIARRVIRTLRRLEIRAVAVYSAADADLPFVAEADEAILLGPADARQSYLDPDRIIEAAKVGGAQAVHPCYGFL
jgi:acetyl-CoA carboxylase biotin carboxylase subunit